MKDPKIILKANYKSICITTDCSEEAKYVDEFGGLYCKKCMLEYMESEDLENMNDHIEEYFKPII